MAKVRRIGLLGAVVALLVAVGVAQAGAATVTITPNGTKTLTSTVPARLTVGSGGASFRSCTMTGTWTSTSGTLPLAFSPPTGVLSPIDNTKGNLMLACAGCTISGVACTLTCDGRANVLALAVTSSQGTTPLRVTGIRCTLSVSSSCSATLASAAGPVNDGGVNATYDNASSTLIVQPTGQNLGISGSACSLISNGVATLTAASGGPLPFRVTPTTTVVVV